MTTMEALDRVRFRSDHHWDISQIHSNEYAVPVFNLLQRMSVLKSFEEQYLPNVVGRAAHGVYACVLVHAISRAPNTNSKVASIIC